MSKSLFTFLIFLSPLLTSSSDPSQNEASIHRDLSEPSEEPEEQYESSTDAFTNEWRTKMKDFESTYVYIIPIPYKTVQIFYENITSVPARVRGAFIIDDRKKDKIDFKIKDPNGKVLYSNITHQAIFDLNVTVPGFYEILFNNRFKNGEIKPTFTMNTAQNDILKKSDLNKTEEKLDELVTFLKSLGTEDKMKRNVQRKRYKKLIKTNRYFYTFSIIETAVLLVVSVWQFYYMKNLFERKSRRKSIFKFLYSKIKIFYHKIIPFYTFFAEKDKIYFSSFKK